MRQPFRYAAHVSGAADLKPRDYSPAETVEAATPYAAYFAMRGAEAPLEPGDVLELETGELRIFKFVGFEEARWTQPEPKADTASHAQPEASAAQLPDAL
ncbi:MAG TPA: hypothetical protein VH639_11205 [Bryobacteraceae bacterium]